MAISKEARQKFHERVQMMMDWVSDDPSQFSGLQILMVDALRAESVGDEMLEWFSDDKVERDEAASAILELAITGNAFIAMELARRDQAKAN